MSIFKVSSGNQINQIISLPDRCATLIAYNGIQYVYNISLNFNALAAVQKGALLVDIKLVNPDKTNLKGFNYFRNKTSDEIVENLRRINGLLKDDALGMSTDPSYYIDIGRDMTIDMSTFISNAEISSLRRGILPNRTVKRLVTRPISGLAATDEIKPVLNINTNNPGIPNGYGTTVLKPDLVREQLQTILFEGRIDPGSIWRPTNTYVSAKKTTGGVIPRKPYTSDLDVGYDSRILNILSTQLRLTPLAQNQNDLAASDYISVVESVPLTNGTASKNITIPVGIIGINDFILQFRVRNTSGKIFQTINYVVLHGNNIRSFIPSGAPIVKTSKIARVRNVAFTIQQTDPNAVGVYIYRKKIDVNNPLSSAGFEQINRISTGDATNNYFTSYVDTTATSVSSYIYRFVPYTFEDIKSTAYASVAVKIARQGRLPDQPVTLVPNYGLVYSEIRNNGIQVFITKIPQAVNNVYIYRRNITTHEPDFKIIGIIQIADPTTLYSTIDTSVNLNNVYEYRVDLLYKNGTVATIPNILQVEFDPLEVSNALLNVTNIRTEQNGNNIDIKFKVEYQLQEENFELFRKLLKEQNLLAEYQEEISFSRDRIQTFLSYGVTRTNLTTGRIEDFGIINTNDFSDVNQGRAKNVTPLNPQNRYRYTLTLYVRSPDSLLEDLRRTAYYDVVAGKSSNVPTSTTVEYQFSPFKWFNPLAIKTGNLISQDKYAEIPLAQGYVADRKYVDVNVAQDSVAEISNVTATQIRPGSILIEWTTTGNYSKIDHYIIKAKISGVVNIIGSAHNFMNTGTYKFMYNLNSEEAGAITFSVTPVYYDFRFGTETVTNTLVI
jgi:hypothetical protein